MTALPPHRGEEREIFFPHLPHSQEVFVYTTTATSAPIVLSAMPSDPFTDEMITPPSHDDESRAAAVASLTAEVDRTAHKALADVQSRLRASQDVTLMSTAGMELREAYLRAGALREQLARNDRLSPKGHAEELAKISATRDAAIAKVEQSLVNAVGDRILASFPATALPVPTAETATDINLTIAAFPHMLAADIAEDAMATLQQALHGTTGNQRMAANQVLKRAYLPKLRSLAATKGEHARTAEQVAGVIKNHLHVALGGVDHNFVSDRVKRSRETFAFLIATTAKNGHKWSDTLAQTGGTGFHWQFDGRNE